MIAYRLYTEDKNRRTIEKLVSNVSPGFTLLRARGYWQGASEKSLVIEILGSPKDKKRIEQLARAIQKANKQDAVYLTAQKIVGELVA